MRNYYFDFIRGITIMMVVAIHTFSISNFDGLSNNLSILIRQSLNCAVPLFLAISGFFLVKVDLSNKNKIASFWKKQIPKIYIPCLIWSFPLFLLSLKNGNNPLTQIVLLFTCGYGVYYFIALIIQYYFLLPVLQKLNKYKGLIISGFISSISILVITYVVQIKGMSLPLIIYAGTFTLWIVFFYSGIFLAKTKRDYPIIIPIIVVLTGLMYSYFESKYLYSFNGGGFGIKLSAFIYSIGIIFFLFNKRIELLYNDKYKVLSIIRNVGDISFGIYLIHCFFIPYITFSDSWIIRWACTLSLSVCIVLITKIISPSLSKKYLGFQ